MLFNQLPALFWFQCITNGTFGYEQLADYLVNLQFHIETDHKPLVPLLSTKHVEELPKWLLCLLDHISSQTGSRSLLNTSTVSSS